MLKTFMFKEKSQKQNFKALNTSNYNGKAGFFFKYSNLRLSERNHKS